MDIMNGLFRIVLPMMLIAALAYWFLNRGSGQGELRVSASVRGAEIMIDGRQTGMVTDTTLKVGLGRHIITVRKPGLISDPEFAVAEIRRDVVSRVSFDLTPPPVGKKSDSIPPLRDVRQEIFSSGEPVKTVSPGANAERLLIDFTNEAARIGSSTPTHAISSFDSSVSYISPDTVPVASTLLGTKVTVSSIPEGADIWVNGALTSRITPYTFRGLDRGIYSFKVSRAGMQVRPDSVVIALNRDYQDALVAFELAPDSSIPRPVLTVSTAPLAAAIRVDGKPVGVGKVTLEVDFGAHRIDFGDAPGYKTPSSTSVNLSNSEPTADITGTYEKLVGAGFVSVRPGDDFGKFDGSLLRVYVDNELLVDNVAQKFDAVMLGGLLSGKRIVRVQYGDLVNEVIVSALDGHIIDISMRVETFFSKRKLKLRDKSAIPVEEWRASNQKASIVRVN